MPSHVSKPHQRRKEQYASDGSIGICRDIASGQRSAALHCELALAGYVVPFHSLTLA